MRLHIHMAGNRSYTISNSGVTELKKFEDWLFDKTAKYPYPMPQTNYGATVYLIREHVASYEVET